MTLKFLMYLIKELVIWINENLDYDQMILEFWKGQMN